MHQTILSLFLLLLLAACKTTSSYHDKLDKLQSLQSRKEITTEEFIQERIQLDMQRGIEWGEKWNAVMLRNESTESIYDPIMYAHHKKLIDEAVANGDIDLPTAKKLVRMAEGARNARHLRSQKREIQRRQLLLR